MDIDDQRIEQILRAHVVGGDHQIIKAIEEMSELIHSLCRWVLQKNHSELTAGVREEVADCLIMLGQLRLAFDSAAVDLIVDRKLDRTLERLNG